MQLTNEKYLQLLGEKEIQIYSLRLHLSQAQNRIFELEEENHQLKNEASRDGKTDESGDRSFFSGEESEGGGV
ncbi:MAG: hypothetical protein ACOCQ0_02845 [Desulfosalsimonas sp.]